MELNESPFLDVKSLSEYILVPENTIRSWIARKSIPFIKVPGSTHVRFLKSDILQWMNQGRM